MTVRRPKGLAWELRFAPGIGPRNVGMHFDRCSRSLQRSRLSFKENNEGYTETLHEADFLDTQFNERLRSGVRLSIQITDLGLVLGANTRLLRLDSRQQGISRLAGGEEEERLFALLSVVQRQPISAKKMHWISASLDDWQRGEKAVAHIRLAQANLPQLTDIHDAYRLFLAETVLDQGMTPRALMKALGLDASPLDLIKYDPDQPRVPAGNGRESGRWGADGGGSSGAADKPDPYRVTISEARITQPHVTQPQATQPSFVVPAFVPPVATAPAAGTAVAEELFAAGETGGFLAGLSALAVTVGAGMVAGVIFVPWQKNPQSEGSIPGDPDLHYKVDDDVGTLSLYHQTEDGSKELVAVAQRGRDGIFFEEETGLPIARGIKGSLVFDADALADATDDRDTKAESEPKENEPRLCPDPGPDVPHGSSERAIAYQAQISALNNPQRPLPPGIAVSLIDPRTAKKITYDDCRESDGTMVEAKGPGYGRMLRYPFFQERFTERWTRQASRQISASGGRPLHWFFADAGAAALPEIYLIEMNI